MDIEIRLETEADHREVERITRDAFWDLYKPGCDEHLILHKMRSLPSFVRELDFVACVDGRVAGSIVYSLARVTADDGTDHKVLCMGPLSVSPSLQKSGIGSRLNIHSIGRARELGFRGVVIFGSPAYYHRFGYRNAAQYGITTSDGLNFDPFMALELRPGSLSGVSGRFHEDPVFRTDPRELDEFEKEFPYREKHVTDTQLHI